jgi:dipicolinic acid synthetase, B subunit
MLTNKKIGFGITGSFCTINNIPPALENLQKAGAQIFCFVTKNVLHTNNRFNNANDFIKKLEDITQKKVISEITEAEKFGPFHPLDCMVIAPITGNSLAKLANGITDNAVLMSTKTTLRNRKPVVLAPFTNDALAMNGTNIMKLMNTKKIYFVPFGQDDPVKKPTSMTSDLSKLKDTIICAMDEKQYQPVIIENFHKK